MLIHRFDARRRLTLASLSLMITCGLVAEAANAADGDLDPTFSGDGKALFDVLDGSLTDAAFHVRAASDGSVVVGGRARTWEVVIFRVRADGTLDTTFGDNGLVIDPFGENIALIALEILGDGRILAVAAQPAVDLTLVARLLADGELDPSYGVGGIAALDDAPLEPSEEVWAFAAGLDDAGRLVVGGRCRSVCVAGETFVTRREEDGDPDPTYGTGGWAVVPEVVTYNVISCSGWWACSRGALEGDGHGGVYFGSHFDARIVRIDDQGELVPSFGVNGVADLPLALPAVRALALDRAGDRLYVALTGGFSPFEGGGTGVARVLPDGSLDQDFGLAGFVNLTTQSGAFILDLELQSDGKVLAAGMLDPIGDEEASFYVVRLLPDGSLDPTFDNDGRVVVDFDLTPDGRDVANGLTLSGGKVVLAGTVENAGSSNGGAFGLARLQSTLIFTDGFESGSTVAW